MRAVMKILFFSATQSGYYKLHRNRRVTSVVIETVQAEIPQLCVNHCLATDGCQAVNFQITSKTNCELTSGLTNTSDLIGDNNSDVYVIGAYKVKVFFHNSIFA